MSANHWQLRNRATGEVVDLGPIPESQSAKTRALDGMVWKIDFARFELIEVEAGHPMDRDMQVTKKEKNHE